MKFIKEGKFFMNFRNVYIILFELSEFSAGLNIVI